MSDDSLLEAKVREAVLAGSLPKRLPDKLWGGSAIGDPCALCGESTTLGEVELELEFTRDSDRARTTYHVHPCCFSVFSLELRRRFKQNVYPDTQPAAE
jgi:hypothetical protein